MPRPVAALDADVLVPILSCDFLLTAFDLGIYEPVVSTEALAEVERNLTEGFPQLDPARLRRRVDQMRDALDDHFVSTGSLDSVPEVINTLVAKRTKRPVTADELMDAMRRPFPTMTSAWHAGRI